jgi:hypothetical protein
LKFVTPVTPLAYEKWSSLWVFEVVTVTNSDHLLFCRPSDTHVSFGFFISLL